MKCQSCGSPNLKAVMNVYISVDISDYRRLTKNVIRKKSTEILFMNDDKTSFVCTNCGYRERFEDNK